MLHNKPERRSAEILLNTCPFRVISDIVTFISAMAPQITPQLRERMVFWRYEQHKKASEIAVLTGCAESTVYEILRLHRDFGTTTNPFRCQHGHPRVLDLADNNYIYSILKANPCLYVDEIQQRLFEVRNVEVSIATVCRVIWRLAITHKHVAKEALERDELVRAAWQAEYGDIPKEAFIWLNESSVDDCTNQRCTGWAMMGCACMQRDTFIRGQRFSVLPALTVEGIIALDIFEGSVNKEHFIRLLQEQLVRGDHHTCLGVCLVYLHSPLSGTSTHTLAWPTECSCP